MKVQAMLGVWQVDLGKCESQLARDICQAIISKGYKVQWAVLRYNFIV